MIVYKENTSNDAAVTLEHGDSVSVTYIDANGKNHTFAISTQHLVCMVEHTQSGAILLSRPAADIQYFPPML